MSNESPTSSTDLSIVKLVVLFLGICATLLILGTLGLVYKVLDTPKIDPTSVAVLTGVSGLAGTTIGSLGSLLVSTRSSPPAAPDAPDPTVDPAAPVDVPVDGGAPADPVDPTDDVPPSAGSEDNAPATDTLARRKPHR
jgi:hypothetical protein